MTGSSHSGRLRWFAAAELAGAQHGVIGRRQLRDLGFSERGIEEAISGGRLFPVFRSAYALGHEGIGPIGLAQAAVLACGEGAVASHRSAGALLGIWTRPPREVEVIAPVEAGRTIPGIKRRHVSALAPGDTWICEGVPCTSPSRTIVDMAGITPEVPLRNCVEAAAVRGLLDPAEIWAILRRGRRVGAPTLRLILGDWPPGAAAQTLRSPFEAKMLAAINRAAMERPATNLTLVISGRRVEVDFCWPRHRLVVETDGAAYHENPIARKRDREREILLEGAGYRVLRVRWDELEQRPGPTLARISAALESSAVG